MITTNDFFEGIDNISIEKNYTDETDVLFNDNFDFDIDASIASIKAEGITEEEIEEMFNVPDSSVNNSKKKTKKTQAEIDQEMVNEFVNHPTNENFNKLWQRFYFGVKGHAYKFMHIWELADDIACQTFTRAWEFKDKYDPEKAKFSTWLYTICRNLCLGEINKVKKDNYVPNDISDLYDSTLLANSAAISSTDSTQYIVEEGELIANSKDDIVTMMYNSSLNEIKNLGGTYTKILTMKLLKDMKIKDIAEELNMNESTVKNYLYKGKEMVQEIMKKQYKSLYDMYIDSTAAEINSAM